MALLAAPCRSAICIEEKDAQILEQKDSAVLNALRKIRRAEAASGDAVRLKQLDEQIRELQKEDGCGK